MGNGSSVGTRMAISAVADMMPLNQPQLIELRNASFRRAVKPSRQSKEKNMTFRREDLCDAMDEIDLDFNDKDVLEHLYTMWDKSGQNKVDVLYFFSGISSLACATMDVESKLYFAFEIFDVDNTGRMKRKDAKKIFNGINSTASYFGDAVLSTKAIDVLVDDVYKDQSEIFFEEYMDLFAEHPAIVQFTSCGGTVKYNA